LSQRLIQPYLAMAIILLVLSVVIYKSPLPKIEQETDNNEDSNTLAIFAFPQLVLGAVTLFFYVGVEVIAGDTIGLFGKELGVVNYTQLTSYTMAFMVITYLIGMVCIPRFISQEKALTISALLGIFLSLLIMLYPRESSYIWTYLLFWTSETKIPDVVIFVAMLGFANALVWPTIWPMALNGLGKHVSTGSALLIMGISGGAILPFVYGIISDFSGDVQMSYMIMIPCYLFILFYALKGHKMIAWQVAAEK